MAQRTPPPPTRSMVSKSTKRMRSSNAAVRTRRWSGVGRRRAGGAAGRRRRRDDLEDVAAKGVDLGEGDVDDGATAGEGRRGRVGERRGRGWIRRWATEVQTLSMALVW